MDAKTDGRMIGAQAAKNVECGYPQEQELNGGNKYVGYVAKSIERITDPNTLVGCHQGRNKLNKDTLIEIKWRIMQQLITAAVRLPRGKAAVAGFETACSVVKRAFDKAMRNAE